MSILGTTQHFAFKLIDFAIHGWHSDEYDNWRSVDALFKQILTINQFQSIWKNATAYVVDDIVVDPDVGLFFKCLVANTSASTGTMAADRTANPTFWAAHTLFGTPKNNFTAIVAPTTGDDSDDGYEVGSAWVDTVLGDHYVCVDATVAAASWKQTTP
jgi:hypothetical protein